MPKDVFPPTDDARPFTPGDKVELKSGSPELTVVAVSGGKIPGDFEDQVVAEGNVAVVWYSHKLSEFKHGALPVVCLQHVQPRKHDDCEDSELKG